LRTLAVHNDNDFETDTARKNLEKMTRRLMVPLVRVGTKSHLAKKVVVEKFKMNAPFGASLVAEQMCEACQIGFESAAYNLARKKGIRLVFWGDSKDESTASYHALVRQSPPSRLKRYLSPRIGNMIAYKAYLYLMQREYGPHSPQGAKQIHLYDYIRWDRKVIVDTIQNELDWAAPDDSPTTWRIDCSLVPLVDYLSEVAYGVSKIELGFSNMVRNGKMDRDDAIERVALIKRNRDVDGLKRFLTGLGIPPATAEAVLHDARQAKTVLPVVVRGGVSA
jgi:hypothetical protein